jgi:prefoldin subunit 5
VSDMETQLANRLQTLREEFDKGQRQLEQLDHQRQEVRDTLLRISGAIQVLEELSAGAGPFPAHNGHVVESPNAAFPMN